MRHYRLGNDLMLRVALFDVSAEGLRQPHSLTGEVSMIATTKLDSVKLTVSSVENNIITATFTGAEMRAEGVYTLTVVEHHGEHSRTIDICHAFELVGCACEASGEVVSNDMTLDIESVVTMLPYTIDEVLDPQSTNAVQNRAVAQAVDALAKEMPDVSDFVTKDGLAQSLNGKVDKVDGKGLSTNDFDNEAKAEVAKVEGKQDKLIVSPLGNGNIKVEGLGDFMAATPSGDPDHALYEAVGAVWNGDNDCWEYAGVLDITKGEMTRMWLDAYKLYGGTYLNGWFAQSPVRVNICTSKWGSAASMQRMFELASSLEVAVLGQMGRAAIPNNIISAFYGCRKLKSVANAIDMQYCTTSTTYAFTLCSELRDITINNLKVGLDLSYCLLLTKKSLLNLIQKAAPTSAITIKVNADVYAWASTDAEVQAALAAQPLVTLISA